jgi:hypothetical protein
VGYIFSQSLRMLGKTITVTCDSLLTLYLTVADRKLIRLNCMEFYNVLSKARKMERIERMLAALCQNRFFSHN